MLCLFAVVLAGCPGWGGPVDDDQPLTPEEVLQRQQTIAPLEEVPDELRGEPAPVVLEFYVDDQGRIRVNFFPHVIDPAPPPADEPDLEEPLGEKRWPVRLQ